MDAPRVIAAAYHKRAWDPRPQEGRRHAGWVVPVGCVGGLAAAQHLTALWLDGETSPRHPIRPRQYRPSHRHGPRRAHQQTGDLIHVKPGSEPSQVHWLPHLRQALAIAAQSVIVVTFIFFYMYTIRIEPFCHG